MRVSVRSANRSLSASGFGFMLVIGGCMSPVDGPLTEEEEAFYAENPGLDRGYTDSIEGYLPGLPEAEQPDLRNDQVGGSNDDMGMQGLPMSIADDGGTMVPNPGDMDDPDEPTAREIRLSKCGDGLVNWENGETCDDGGANTLGCRNDCLADVGFYCEGEPSECRSKCGDAVLASNESCDDGNFNDGDGCDFACFVEEGFFCTNSPSVCGLICGDGLQKGDELCDDGNFVDGDGCNATCEIEPGWDCSADGCTAICGDGMVLPQEACDDGNLDAEDGCSAICTVETYYECWGEPSVCGEKEFESICGDGIVDIEAINPEECDDGNDLNGDGCEACRVEPSFLCDGEPSVCIELE